MAFTRDSGNFPSLLAGHATPDLPEIIVYYKIRREVRFRGNVRSYVINGILLRYSTGKVRVVEKKRERWFIYFSKILITYERCERELCEVGMSLYFSSLGEYDWSFASCGIGSIVGS